MDDIVARRLTVKECITGNLDWPGGPMVLAIRLVGSEDSMEYLTIIDNREDAMDVIAKLRAAADDVWGGLYSSPSRN